MGVYCAMKRIMVMLLIGVLGTSLTAVPGMASETGEEVPVSREAAHAADGTGDGSEQASESTPAPEADGTETKEISELTEAAPKKVTPVIKLSKTTYVYNGKAKKPSVTVTVGKTTLPKTAYTISYDKGRKKVGKYSVKVTLKGNYRGSKSKSFRIIPKTVSISRVSSPAGKELKVSWKKNKKQISGYEVKYSTRKNLKSAVTKKIKKSSAVSCTIQNLKSRKKYYVRIRAYKKAGSKTYYGNWSKKRSVTIAYTDQELAGIEARKFIAAHTGNTDSNTTKFRKCFYYIIGHNQFIPSWRPPGDFTEDWEYRAAVSMFQNNLRGNCFGVASAVAAVAKELGYKPYVYRAIEGHAFVYANGKYYDNMGGAVFGRRSQTRRWQIVEKFPF